MPIKQNDREYRSMPCLVRRAEGSENEFGSDYYVEGYAAIFDEPYLLYDDVSEVVMKSAFEHTDMSDIIMLYDHTGRVLARAKNGTLKVTLDDKGIFIKADLSKSEAARNLYEEIQNQLVTKMSWAFTVSEQTYDSDSKTIQIKGVEKIYDVSAVTRPANDATEISARAAVDGVIEAAKTERLKRRNKLKRLELLARAAQEL